MAMGDETKLTDKQQAWIDAYLVTLNATEAARRVYDSDDYSTLQSIGSENLSKPVLRAELDRRFRERAMGADELIMRESEAAALDIGPYVQEDGTLDLKRMREDGKTRLITGLVPGRDGLKVELVDPHASRKLLARYHGLLSDRLDVTVEHKPTPQGEEIGHLVNILRDLTVPIDDSTATDDT